VFRQSIRRCNEIERLIFMFLSYIVV
jgi:hypothetical protein